MKDKMTDIVERLRAWAAIRLQDPNDDLVVEAADEIERLRSLLKRHYDFALIETSETFEVAERIWTPDFCALMNETLRALTGRKERD